MKKRMMKFAMPVLLLATLTACGNFEWFPDNTTATTPSGSTPQTPTTPTATTKTQMGGAIQGNPLTLAATVTTFAGSTYFADGTGAAARFDGPVGVTSDGTNLYVADAQNNTIRKIVIATGAVTTLAGTAGQSDSTDGTGTAARFNSPNGVTTDGTNLYVADTNNKTIRKIAIATGAVTTIAGIAGQVGSSDGIGTAARFNVPIGLALTGGNLYIVDSSNNNIRQMGLSTDSVTTLAGSAGTSQDGIGTAARFNQTIGATTDGTNLYVADTNSTIRKIVITTGEVTTIAGAAGQQGSSDGLGTAARFTSPMGITTDGTNLYVADFGSNTIRTVVIATGAVSTLAGTTGQAGSADGISGAARFNNPIGITTDNINLYVADYNNHTIRKIVIATGAVTTLAGSAGQSGSADGVGTSARFFNPDGITTDGTNLYVADTQNHSIRKIAVATGVVTKLAATDTLWITTDGTNLYSSGGQSVNKIVIATAAVTTLAGATNQFGSIDGTGSVARFSLIHGGTTDGTSLYVVDSGNRTIRKIQ
jgi:sugar lactone lactonase YvrE